MITYHLSIHKHASSYAGMDTFTSRELQLDNEQDFAQAKRLCENRKNMAGFWKQTILPIRTDRASDLFSPTLMNSVIKTKDFAESYFAVMAAIVWDLATLPIRLLTFLPRMGYNAMAKPEEHPLISYLKGKGLSSIEIEGIAPAQSVAPFFENGKPKQYFGEKDGRVNVLLYTKKVKEGRIDERKGEKYRLYLTDREIAFPRYGKFSFCFKSSLDGRPLPEFVNS